jgi:hypothetical protein
MTASVADHGNAREQPPTTYYDDLVRIPGMGDSPDRCRQMKPIGFCRDHGHPVLGRSSCGTRYCPDHWRDWAEEATISQVARLAAYRHVAEGAEKRLSHVVASPPQDRRYSLDQLWKTRGDAYDALKAAGVRGGSVVTHAYRTNDRADTLYETVTDQGDLDEDYGKWRYLRESTDDWEEMTEYVEAAPHYHTMAAAEDVAVENAPEGWVVKRIRSFSRFHIGDLESYKDMAAGVYYVLSHGATQSVGTNRATSTYFGEVHPAVFKPEDELTDREWREIQEKAEEAVRGWKDDEEGVGAGPDECPCEDCTSPVIGIEELADYLYDEDWVKALRRQEGGYTRWLKLRGLQHWYEGGDRPPPSGHMDQSRLEDWLERQGRKLAGPRPDPVQSGLGTFS